MNLVAVPASGVILLSLAIAAGDARGQCSNECGVGDTAEGEVCPTDEYVDATNGGCNFDPLLLHNVSCGETICGTASTFLVDGVNNRDTDWYYLSPTELTNADTNGNGIVRVEATLTAQFSGLVGVFSFQPDCSNVVAEGTTAFSAGGCAPAFSEATITVADHPFGIMVIVAPDVFVGFECGTGLNDYTVLIDCADPAEGCAVGGQPCNQASVSPGCGDVNCCLAVCGQDSFCCTTAWDAICVDIAIDLACAVDASPDVCLATGSDPGQDGYLQVCVDPFGAWASTGYGGSGDMFNPAGPNGALPIGFTAGLFHYDLAFQERELLSNSLDWQTLVGADSALQRDVVTPSIASDTDGDGVDDRAVSLFRIIGFNFSLLVYLDQRVESAGPGVSTITQYYAITNESEFGFTINMVRHFDGDFTWSAPILDDVVGTNTNGDNVNDRYVYMHETGDTAAAVTLSARIVLDPVAYYGAKNGTDPDDAGPDPAMGPGTSTEVWDAYGLPPSWSNYIAGVGADADGDSGGLVGDAHVALDIPVWLQPDFTPILAIRHTYGDIVPVPIDVCGVPVSGDCGSANSSPGCQDAECCQMVCAQDPFCCDQVWDGLCLTLAQDLCGFTEGESPAAGGANSETVGDLDGDGNEDAVAVIPDFNLQANGAIQVFLNLGTLGDGQWLGFVPLPPVAVGLEPTGVIAGDFDADGDLDLAVSNRDSDNVSILLNNGDATFAAPTTVSLGAGDGPSDVVTILGLNGLDLLVTLEAPGVAGGDFVVLQNDGNGVFTPLPQQEVPLQFGPVSMTGGDFDGNKCPDVAGAGSNDAVGLAGEDRHVFVRREDPGQIITTQYTIGDMTDPRDVAIGDFDDDGFNDMAIPDHATGTIWFLWNDGFGDFRSGSPLTFTEGQGQPRSIVSVDLDGDGCPGFAIGDADFPGFGPSLIVVPRCCGEWFEIGYLFSGGGIPEDVASGDFNVDCIPDLVTAEDDTSGGGAVNGLISALQVLFPCVGSCPADLDGDQMVGINDFLSLLGQWGTDPGGPPDFDGDMTVGINDFLTLLANWGPCPLPSHCVGGGAMPESGVSGRRRVLFDRSAPVQWIPTSRTEN